MKIITCRDMILRPLDGEPQHVDSGTEILVSAAVLDQLHADDYELAPAI